MNINKNSWHYKLYKWTFFGFFGSNLPNTTTLCAYMSRILGLTALRALLTIFVVVCVWGINVVLLGLITPFLFLMGKLPNFKIGYLSIDQGLEHSYTFPLPKIKSYNIYPGYILSLVLFVVLNVLSIINITNITTHSVLISFTLSIDFLVLMVVFISFKALSKISFVNNIFYQWIKAKKEKVCPIIEFKD